KTYTYNFNGWYTATSGGSQIINSSKALVANTSYTNSSSQWTSTSAPTLYAQWGNGTAITLPTITKTGHTCGWTTSTNTSSWTYTSGQTITPTASMTLHGVCTVNSYSVKVNFAGSGVSSVTFAASGYTSRSVTSSGGTASLVYNVPYTMTMAFTSGYEFESWALNSTSYGTLSSTSANPATFTIKASNDGVITATGKNSAYCTSSDANCMQYSAEQNSCGSTLIDARDGNTYSTSIIGNLCYMTKNLDLAGGTTLTSTLSNVSSDYTLPASSTSGFSDESTAYVYNSGSTSCGSNSPCYSYYSYVAATAGTNPSSGNATSDICPKGWRLPTQAEFNTLISSYSTSSDLTGSPFLAVYGGNYYNSSFYTGGSGGHYWSSTASNSSNAYDLLFSKSVKVDLYNKSYGFGVRCVRQTAPTTVEKFNSGIIITMQEVDSTFVSAMTTDTQYTFTDSRDSQQYTAAKLGDGRVWMTRNLAIGCNGSGSSYGSSRKNASLSSSDSNVSSSYTINTSNVSNLTTDTLGNLTKAYMQCNPTYGAWYNYMAATAGTISGNSNTTEATSDICPSGWRLPTYAEQQAITSYTTAFSPVTGGVYIKGSLGGTGNGYWWSSTASNDDNRYFLNYYGSSLNTNSGNRYRGFYVRCVLETPTMQDFTASDAAAMATGEARILKDSRDSQNYTVAKLPDGKVWMTQNLNLPGGTTLTSADSNVTSNYTLPASSTSGFSSDSTAYVYNSGRTNCSSPGCYSYYSYAAATAGTNPSSGAATSDICPKGWRLPTQSEFNTLISSYSTGSALTGSPFLAVYGGSYYSSSFVDSGGSVGHYWSSTASNSSNAYGLLFGSNNARVDYYYKSYGDSVRCVKS
ncbi:DUF1566 domain-containing protein, partial [Candidatus Saccharibacteria bacterium]|nr:DUF1566 domain-containing protein [Candidatus Saccharibacteria bacterium]